MALADDIKNGVARQTCIKFLNSTLPEIKTGFHSGTISFERSICDTQGELVFGGCVASQFKATIEGIDDIAGKRVQVYQVIGDNTVVLITGTVASSEISSDKNSRDVIIYDDLYTLRGKNVAEWYNALKFPLSLNSFTRSLLTNMKVSASTSMNLSQSNVQVTKTVNTDALSFGDVIKPICSLCGGFGYMTPEGKFDILYLTNDTVDLTIASGFKAQQFETKAIDKVQIRSSETDIGGIAGTGTNAYILQGNFICYDKTAEELNAIATTLLNKIQGHPYTPFSGSMIISDPTLDLSKLYNITSASGETSISSYIFSTKFSGIQTFECEIASGGKEERTEVVSDTNTELSIVNNKWLNLTKNVDGLSVEVGKKVDGNSIISSINASPEQIQINSSRVNITGLASFISVGDRNLLLATKNFGKISTLNGDWSMTTDNDGFTVASRTGNGNWNAIQTITTINAQDNPQSDKTFILAVDVYADDLATSPKNYLIAFEVYGSNNNFKSWVRTVYTNVCLDGSGGSYIKVLSGTRQNNKWCRLYFTITPTNLTSGAWGTYSAYRYGMAMYTTINNIGHTVRVRKFKMSFGNVPSDWSPNPDDISVENIYKDDTTLIDGGKIYTGSVKAKQIDVNNVFAQDIKATGTITGATLKGTTAEIDNGSIGGFNIANQTLTATFDCWGDYTASDYTKIKEYAWYDGTLNTQEKTYYDVNKDGKVDILDMLDVRTYLWEDQSIPNKPINSKCTVTLNPSSTDTITLITERMEGNVDEVKTIISPARITTPQVKSENIKCTTFIVDSQNESNEHNLPGNANVQIGALSTFSNTATFTKNPVISNSDSSFLSVEKGTSGVHYGVSTADNKGIYLTDNARWLIREDSNKNTYVSGDKVYVSIKPTDPTGVSHSYSFRPYLTIFDSIQLNHSLGGYITGNGISLAFFIPVNVPMVGDIDPYISFDTGQGVTVRQDGKYCYGSSASTKVQPAKQSIKVMPGSGMNVVLTMPNSTNVINNDACGITIIGTLNFSMKP